MWKGQVGDCGTPATRQMCRPLWPIACCARVSNVSTKECWSIRIDPWPLLCEPRRAWTGIFARTASYGAPSWIFPWPGDCVCPTVVCSGLPATANVLCAKNALGPRGCPVRARGETGANLSACRRSDVGNSRHQPNKAGVQVRQRAAARCWTLLSELCDTKSRITSSARFNTRRRHLKLIQRAKTALSLFL